MTHAFVVAAYGDSPYLGECIESLIAQAGGEGEIVVTTSTPSHYVREIVGRFGLPLIENPKKRCGIGADWNFALTQTKCRYLTIAHQDDIYSRDYRERVVGELSAHAGAAFAFTDHIELRRAGEEDVSLNLLVKRGLCRIGCGFGSVVKSRSQAWRLLAFGNPIWCSSVTFDRSMLAGFQFDERLQSNLDWDAWQRILANGGRALYVSSPLVVHRVHSETETNACLDSGVRRREDAVMFRRFWPEKIARVVAAVYRLGYCGNRTV